MIEENLSLNFRLKNEARNCFIEEIKYNGLVR